MPGMVLDHGAPRTRATVLQWRAGHVPGLVMATRRAARLEPVLQWRAGHVPGLVRVVRLERRPVVQLQWRAGHVPGLVGAVPQDPRGPRRRFNGGPGTCPAWYDGQGYHFGAEPAASMEGRARARPGTTRAGAGVQAAELQWRAGHVPGLVFWAHRSYGGSV